VSLIHHTCLPTEFFQDAIVENGLALRGEGSAFGAIQFEFATKSTRQV
jgi:hypothetical protein